MKMGELLKKISKFLKEDTWPSFAVTLAIAFIIIKFIFFPALSLVTGTALPLVIVESCSMHHYENGFEKIFESDVYENYGIEVEETDTWAFEDGFSKGDVIFVIAPKNIEVGDVIIFDAGYTHPLIHRVVDNGNILATKGDNYKTNSQQLSSEKRITEDQLIGKALFRVPLIGWAKLLFFEASRPAQERGFCS